VENDLSALMRSLTVARGRNADLAETAIREAKAWSDQEALDGRLIDLIAGDEQDLFRQIEGREITLWNGKKTTLHLAGAEVVEAHRTWREQLMSALADPNLAFILLILGALGVYVEFSHPGLIVPGVAGAILALLGLSGLSVLPISWVGVALLLLSVTLFVLEAKFTSHGVLGAGGTVSMILGAVLLIEGPPELRIHLTTAIAVAIPFALITVFLMSLVIKARMNKVVTGESGMIDTIGVVQTPLAPEGKILVRGEYWSAVSSTPMEPGSQVRVTKVDGLTLRVEPVAKSG